MNYLCLLSQSYSNGRIYVMKKYVYFDNAATTKLIRAGDLKNVFTLPVLFAAFFASIAITWTPYQ
mgnify:CR=1 FL=1